MTLDHMSDRMFSSTTLCIFVKNLGKLSLHTLGEMSMTVNVLKISVRLLSDWLSVGFEEALLISSYRRMRCLCLYAVKTKNRK